MLNIFTIVYQGMPWVEDHWKNFVELGTAHNPCWRWTIVHGLAEPVKDTSWCQAIPDQPDDGTLDYIMSLRRMDRRIQVISRPRWAGKTAMCNAALASFDQPGCLLQMDVDEFWTVNQLRVMPTLFDLFPDANAAQFNARIWVGPRRFTCIPGQWANRDYEWNRLWKFTPGMQFETHEPPRMPGVQNLIDRSATMAFGLVFDHYSYVLRSQIEFKGKYYGPQWSVEAWDKLQSMRGTVNLKDVLPFVDSDATSFETPA